MCVPSATPASVILMRDDQGVYVLACSEADGSVFVYPWDAN